MRNQQANTPKQSGYNVILIYKDGTQFECAESVTFSRAIQIKKETLEARANNEFAFRDVANVRIVKGGNDE